MGAGRVTTLRALLCLQAVLLCAANTPPLFSQEEDRRIIVNLGGSVRLECPVNSNIDFDFDWRKDGQALYPGSDRYILRGRHKNILRIKTVMMDDAGVYTCRAANAYGPAQYNFSVVVKDEELQVFQEGNKQFRLSDDVDIQKKGSKPVFENLAKMQKEQNLIKPKDASITLACRVDGNPRPKIVWLKDGEPLPDSPRQRNQMVKLRDGQAVLKLSWLSDQDDGQYTCVCTNWLGKINFTYTLDVVGEISDKPRLIAPHPINQSAAVGDSVSFHCYVESDESDEKPKVEWLKRVEEGEQVSEPVTYGGEKYQVLQHAGQWLREQLPDGSYLNKLVIHDVQPKDQGMFVCSATNRAGFQIRKAFLSIKPGPGKSSNRGQNPYNVPHSTFLENPTKEQSGRDPTLTAQDDEDVNSNLPLQIALPACGVLVLILLTVFLVQRNNRCRKTPLSPPSSQHHPQRPPVPPHEREAYYFSNCSHHHLQQQQQAVNPLLMSSREKMASPPKMMVITPTPSGEITGGSSDFSSVSRTHPSSNTTPHYYHPNHINYGY